jgi:ParB-like chromosome segregation protein Spo0J
MDINQIRPNPSNPRKINKNDYEKLLNSIKEDPILLNAMPIRIDENNMILAGHQRYRACLELGINDVPVIKMENLTEKQKKKLIIIDNTHYGVFDMDLLANEDWDLHDLAEWNVNLDFFIPTIEEPEKIDNTKKGKICPNCGVSL